MQFYGIIDLSDEGKVRCQNINIFACVRQKVKAVTTK